MAAFDVGAASRPIAGKRGSHRHNASLGAGDTPVGAGLPAMRPALTKELSTGGRFWSKSVSKSYSAMGRHCPNLVRHHLVQSLLQGTDRALDIVQLFESEQTDAEGLEVGRLVALQRHSGGNL